MAIENFSILEAVELAVGIEKEGVRFYALAADKADDPALKELFLDLKKKEHEHIVTFQGLYAELAEKQGDADAALYLLDPEVAAAFHAYVETAVFPVKGAAAKIIEACEAPDDILRLGMQAEKDSILYYHELLSHAPYPEAKDLIRKIIVEEGKHLTFLHRKMMESGAGGSG
jgi:rubrerythrin